jgi:type II secretory pathway component PulK
MSTANDKKGLVLVAVLWVIMVLIVIAAAIGRNSRLDTKICVVRMDEVRCKWTCRAGVERAIAVLNDDLRGSDSLTDLWSENDVDFNDVKLGRSFFTVRVVDEASKLNINTASRKQLLRLEREGMTEEIADAIIDWRDKNDEPRGGGAEAGYYENLRYRYRIRNGRFMTIRELLRVKGVTEELLYGEDTNLNGELDYNEKDGDESPPGDNKDDKLDRGWIAYLTCYSYDRNRDAAGNERININNADEDKLTEELNISKPHAKWIVKNRKNKGYKSIADLINENSPKEDKSDTEESEDAQPLDLATFKDIADKITVDDKKSIPGRVNVNTAPREVLAALLGDDETDEQVADDIITHRGSLLSGMQSIADVLDVESVNVKTFKKIANNITTRSDVYTVRCLATADRGRFRGTRLQTEAVVNRSLAPCKILYWYQGAGPTVLRPEVQQSAEWEPR